MFQFGPNGNSLGTLRLTESARNTVGCLGRITQQALVPHFSSRILEHIMIIIEGEVTGNIDPLRTRHAVATSGAIYPL